MSGVPPLHSYTIIQDHGPDNGGWGPAAFSLFGEPPGPLVYTGSEEAVIERFKELVDRLAVKTLKETRLIKFSVVETVHAAQAPTWIQR